MKVLSANQFRDVSNNEELHTPPSGPTTQTVVSTPFDIDLSISIYFQGVEGIGRLKVEERSKASLITQYSVLTKRSFVNMYRDVGYYWFRLAINLGIALSIGTIFYDVGYAYESIQVCLSSMLVLQTVLLTKRCFQPNLPCAHIFAGHLNFHLKFQDCDFIT